jgi:hypothetical protein
LRARHLSASLHQGRLAVTLLVGEPFTDAQRRFIKEFSGWWDNRDDLADRLGWSTRRAANVAARCCRHGLLTHDPDVAAYHLTDAGMAVKNMLDGKGGLVR